MRVDISSFELHNIVRTPDGGLTTRRALTSLLTPTAGTVYVAGFSIESPNTTEVWHYLFEQSTTDGTVTLRVLTEELVEVFNLGLGHLQKDPVISYAVQYGQIIINSPAFAAPLYALVGGGVVTAVKTPSINPDTTALDMPTGHVCAFGDRMPIAQGNVLFFNDPPLANNVDPRTYVAQNAVPLPGSIFDIFQGDDGVLRIFTSAGVFAIPSDALSQGQSVQGFLQKIPGIETMRPKNAIASGGAIIVLQRDGVLVIAGHGNGFLPPAPTKVNIAPYTGRRAYSQVVAVDDLRLSAELYPHPGGFVVGFRGKRGHFLVADLTTQTFSYVTSTASAFNVVGTLRSRDGVPIFVFKDRLAAAWLSAQTDYDGNQVVGAACGRLDFGGQRAWVRRVTVSADNVGAVVGQYVSGQGAGATKTTPTLAGEAVIGTTAWNVAATQKLAGRQLRLVRTSFAVKEADPNIEVAFYGGDSAIGQFVDVEVEGLDPQTKDKQ